MVSRTAVVAGATILALVLLVAWTTDFRADPDALRRGHSSATNAVTTAPLRASDVPSAPHLVAPREASATERLSAAATQPVPPPALQVATARVIVEARWDDDRSPAQGLGVSATPRWRPHPQAETQTSRTDATGRAVLGVAAPCELSLSLLDGGSAVVELKLGDERTVQLVATRWARVRGRVVDAEGAPAAGAEVWMYLNPNDTSGVAVATVGADGTFDLPAGEWSSIGARKAGYAPSGLAQPHPAKREVVELVLELGEASARISGRVTDESGHPISGASVLVGALEKRGAARGYVMARARAPGVLVRCDVEGFYSVDEVRVDRLPTSISASAPGFAVTTSRFDVSPGDHLPQDLVLRSESKLFGIVRDSRGAAVEGASIGVGTDAEFESSHCRSRRDGTYELGGLRAGQVVHAHLDGVGETLLTVRGEPGDVLEWNPVLDAGLAIHGFVRDEDGAPLAGLRVWGITNPPLESRLEQISGRTSLDGHFVLTNVADTDYTLAVAQEGGRVLVRVKNARARQDPIAITLTSNSMPSAFVTGRLVLPEGLRGDLLLRSHGVGGDGTIPFDMHSGSFEAGPLAPGPYELHFRVDRRHQHSLVEFKLTRGERCDLGAVLVPGRVELTIVVHGSDTKKPHSMSLALSTRDGKNMTVVRTSGTDPITFELLAGSYSVFVQQGTSTVCQAVTLAAGVPRRLELRLTPGAHVEFELEPASNPPTDSIGWRVYDAGGSYVTSAYQARSVGPTNAQTHLPEGVYDVSARASDGRTGQQRFEVGSTGESLRVTVPLRE